MILFDPNILISTTSTPASAHLSAPLTEFTVFQKLPPELRRHIRSYYICGPQLLTLVLSRPATKFKRFRSEVMYQVNQESRAQALLFLGAITSEGNEKDGFATIPLQLTFSGNIPFSYDEHWSIAARRASTPEDDRTYEPAVLDPSITGTGGITSLRFAPTNTIFILQIRSQWVEDPYERQEEGYMEAYRNAWDKFFRARG